MRQFGWFLGPQGRKRPLCKATPRLVIAPLLLHAGAPAPAWHRTASLVKPLIAAIGTPCQPLNYLSSAWVLSPPLAVWHTVEYVYEVECFTQMQSKGGKWPRS